MSRQATHSHDRVLSSVRLCQLCLGGSCVRFLRDAASRFRTESDCELGCHTVAPRRVAVALDRFGENPLRLNEVTISIGSFAIKFVDAVANFVLVIAPPAWL